MFMSTQSLLFFLAASSASWDTARCVAAFEGQHDELVSSNKKIARNTRVRISTFDDPTKGKGGQSNIKSDPRAMEDLRDLSTFLFEMLEPDEMLEYSYSLSMSMSYYNYDVEEIAAPCEEISPPDEDVLEVPASIQDAPAPMADSGNPKDGAPDSSVPIETANDSKLNTSTVATSACGSAEGVAGDQEVGTAMLYLSVDWVGADFSFLQDLNQAILQSVASAISACDMAGAGRRLQTSSRRLEVNAMEVATSVNEQGTPHAGDAPLYCIASFWPT
jgi:hypothetical protein